MPAWNRIKKLNNRAVHKTFQFEGRYKLLDGTYLPCKISYNVKRVPVLVGDSEAGQLTDFETQIELLKEQVASPARGESIVNYDDANIVYRIESLVETDNPEIITVKVSTNAT